MKRLPFTLAAMLFLAACETVPLAHAVDPLLKGGDKNDDSDWTLNAALETLVAAMQDNDSQAAAALGLLGDPRAVDPLLKEAEKNDGYDWTLNAALQSLGQLGDPRAVPVLAARLDDKRTNPAACYRCRIAADALAALGDPGLEALLQRLNDTPDRVRTAVASALGKQKNMRAVPALLSALDEASGGMYRLKRAFFISIVVSLGQLGDERAVEPLIRFLDISAGGKNYHSLSHSEDLAIPMIRALGQIGDERAVPILTMEPILHGSPDLRMAAVIALSRINSASAVTPLLEALQDEDPVLRRYAAIGLSNGDARAVDPLEKALNDKDASVRCRAAASLAKLNGRLGSDISAQLDMVRLQRMIKQRPLVAVGEFTDNSAWEFNHYDLAVPDHFRRSLAKHLMAAGYEVDLVPSGFQPFATITGAINTYHTTYPLRGTANLETSLVRIITLGLVVGHYERGHQGSMRVAMDIAMDGKSHRRIYTKRAKNKSLPGLVQECSDAIARNVAR